MSRDERFCARCGTRIGEAVSAVAAAVPVAPESFGEGRYQVKRTLGQGTRKYVYLARDRQLDRDVVVAVVRNDETPAASRARLQREIRAAARLGDHPHLVTILDRGEADGCAYFVRPYLAGGSLADRLAAAEAHRLPLEEVLRVASGTCEGLIHAHARGIVHRDLEPGNIWLTEEGLAKLGDFGLAVALDRSELPQAGQLVGTVAYMAPEQALGQAVDPRSDLYALGAVMYEMVCGHPPFKGEDVVAVISQHIHAEPVPPDRLVPDLPAALGALILRLLAKLPPDRPANAAEVRAALGAILRDPMVPAAASSQSQRPTEGRAGEIFVGRDLEMGRLHAGLERALAGHSQVLMLVGEPGIGKTRMAEELVTLARSRGANVLWGRCYEGEGAPAFWPWLQVLRAIAREHPPDQIRAWLGSGASDIAQAVPEVRALFGELPDLPRLEAEAARFRLFDSLATFVRNLARTSPVVLVLDDLHWADEPSLALLRFLIREIHDAPILVVGSYRDVEVRRGHPLSETLAILAREGSSERVILRGLARRDVEHFLNRAIGPDASSGLVDRIFEETEGNPFFLHEVVRLLVADHPTESIEALQIPDLLIPQSVRDVIGQRLDRLSPSCNRMLGIAAVMGREFEQTVLERVSEFDPDRLLDLIEEARNAGIVSERSDSLGRYRFSHALVRETLYEELSTPRRVRLHREIGDVLEAFGDRGEGDHLSELAHHFFQSVQTGSAERAIEYSVAAAERAIRQRAYEEAVVHFDRALQASDFQESADETKRLELFLDMGDAQRSSGAHGPARETFERAARLAWRLGSVPLLARAAIGYARLLVFGVADPQAANWLERALSRMGGEDSALRARLLGLSGLVSRWGLGLDRAGRLATQAVDMARRVGDLPTLAHALDVQHIVANPLTHPAQRIAIPRELIEVAESIGDHELAFAGHIHLLIDLFEQGDIAAVQREIEALEAVVRILRQPLRELALVRVRVALAVLQGRFDEAEHQLEASKEASRRVSLVSARRLATVQEVMIELFRGSYDDAIKRLMAWIENDPALPLYAILAFAHAEAGQESEARQAYAQALEADLDAGLSDLGGIALTSLLARTSVLLGDSARAERFYAVLRPLSDRNVQLSFFLALGSVAGTLGLLATILGRWEEADPWFQQALRENERQGARTFVALNLYDYAQMCFARAAPGDSEHALELVNQALEAARAIGMRATVEKALALKLQLQGIRPGQDLRDSIEEIPTRPSRTPADARTPYHSNGSVTLMFSDMEGFSSMTERLGDQRALKIVRHHNSIVRKALASHGGHEVELQGDGFLLAFMEAQRALECAVEIQRAFQRYSEQHPEQPIRVRIGLHVGETIKEGDRFFGKTVILASRIADQARSGEILVSAALRERMEDARGLVFRDERDLQLKGLSGTYRVWSLTW